MTARFARRLLFGSLLIGVMAATLLFDEWRARGGGRPLAAPLLVLAVALPALSELITLLALAGLVVPRALLLGACALLLVGKAAIEFQGSALRHEWFVLLFVLDLVAVAVALFRDRDLASGARRSAAAALVLLVALLLSSMIDLTFRFGTDLLFALVMTAKAGDSGAYLVGKSLGRHKLIEHISPKKTIEGAIGGLAGSLLVAWWLIGHYGAGRWTTAEALLIGAVLFVTGHVGDLLESLWKRAAGVKDSGRLLPEFGGALDIVDSLFLAMPAGGALLAILAG